MAVLVEGISAIVRRDTINARLTGGWSGFLDLVPNNTLCADEDLARVGFLSPTEVEHFIRCLEKGGLIFIRDGKAVDLAVVDQQSGPTMPAEWLEFAHLPFEVEENRVAACWLFDEPRIEVHGIHTRGGEMVFATPDGWSYKNSLSENFKYFKTGKLREEVKFLRYEDDADVYMHLPTGEEIFMSPGTTTYMKLNFSKTSLLASNKTGKGKYLKTGASFSSCRKYRYKLWRIWDESKPMVMFLGLNPSTADETKDDPTVAKCQRYAREWGYGGMYMANIFAYRATDPAKMKVAKEPVGSDNDTSLIDMASLVTVVIAAWGNHGDHLKRSQYIRNLLPNLHYLKLNTTGEPAHPLYLKKSITPAKWILG